AATMILLDRVYGLDRVLVGNSLRSSDRRWSGLS
ncbi:hypothetical protein Pgy4_41804, partial [Pseudomonas savastanoi pv. glycinea str. race 4]